MNIQFCGEFESVKTSLNTLKSYLNFTIGGGDKKITVSQCSAGYLLNVDGCNAQLSYADTHDFNRALAIAVEAFRCGLDIHLNQQMCFDTCSLMIDLSRGAVMKTEKLKEFIALAARMGFNEIMLYTEDVYTLKDYPYFGYMRGRYSVEELKDIVAFASSLGIETVPCIQTLGHLSSALRWKPFANIKDADTVLLIDEPDTYSFIEVMIQTVREIFTSNKIQIGMDEAHGVGLGEFLNRNGYQDRFEILSRHLSRVVKLCHDYNFEPMMWSDMFFRLATPNGDYYHEDARLPDNVSSLIPEGVSLVYWDYYHTDEKMYDVMVSQHQKMKCPIAFAGGIWTWSGPSVNLQHSVQTTVPALRVCRRYGISQVICTIWGDDGAECDVHQALWGIQLFAECCYGSDYSKANVNEMFKLCTGLDAEFFLSLDTEDFTHDSFCSECEQYQMSEKYISKQILYHNPLLGLFDKNFEGKKLSQHYDRLCNITQRLVALDGYETMLECHRQLLKILTSKCDIGIRLKMAYDAGDISQLSQLASELYIISDDTEQLRLLRMKLWFENNRPFGYEEVNNRLAAAAATARLAADRVSKYAAGEFLSLDELAEERLPYNGDTQLFVNEPNGQKIMVVRTGV